MLKNILFSRGISGGIGFGISGGGSSPAPSLDSWETKASMGVARYGAGVGAIGTLAYIVGGDGGLTVNEEYNSITDTYTTKASPAYGRVGQALVNYGGELYMFGGTNFSIGIANTEKYNNVSNAWTEVSSMPQVRWNIEACVVGDEILIPGGYHPSNPYSTDNQAYKPSTNTWTTYASLPTGRYSHMVNAVDGEMIVSGGYNGSYMTDMSLFNKGTNSWSSLTAIPNTLGVASSGVMNGEIFFAGGLKNGSYTNETIAYKKSTDSWRVCANMPTARGIQGKGAVIGNKMGVFGGYYGGNLATNEFYNY